MSITKYIRGCLTICFNDRLLWVGNRRSDPGYSQIIIDWLSSANKRHSAQTKTTPEGVAFDYHDDCLYSFFIYSILFSGCPTHLLLAPVQISSDSDYLGFDSIYFRVSVFKGFFRFSPVSSLVK